MIAAVIVACEIGFWVVLASGMLLRYAFGRPRLGAVVLAGVPLVDVVLLAAAAVDLARGAEFETEHGLAAAYLGFSLAFGHSLVRWADVRFAHRFAGGPPPPPRPVKGSTERVVAMWREWGRVVLAAAIASLVLGGLTLVAHAGEAEVIASWAVRLWTVAGIWLVAGPLWESASRTTRRRPSPAP
jgi:hypothetical protein